MGKVSIDELKPAGRIARDEDFRRVVLLQVYLPLGLGLVLVATVVGAALVAGGAGGLTASGMADVSLILLVVPALLLGLIALVGLVAMGFGVGRLIGWLPPRARKAERLVARIARKSQSVADRSVQLVMVPRAFASAVRTVLGSLRFRR